MLQVRWQRAARLNPVTSDTSRPHNNQPAHGVSMPQAFRVWLRVASLSFGGPAGQIAVMHRILVEEKRWIGESRFLHALNYCMLLPGPEAQQLATYIGWLMHGTRGGILAGGLFVLPGMVSIMALSYVYAAWGHVALIVALFAGLKAAVLAIVFQAVIRIGRRALKDRVMLAIAAVAFIAIYFFAVPFPLIIIIAGLVGLAGSAANLPAFQARNADNGAGADPGRIRRVLSGRAGGDEVGLHNVDERLRTEFGEEYGLEIETGLGAGTTVSIRIPKFRTRVAS